MIRKHFKKIAATLCILTAGIVYLQASNPAIQAQGRLIKSGAVKEVIINGNVVREQDLRAVTPGITYEWTPGLAEEGTRPPNIGPGLENE